MCFNLPSFLHEHTYMYRHMMRSMRHLTSWQLGHYSIPGCLHYASFPKTGSGWLCLFMIHINSHQHLNLDPMSVVHNVSVHIFPVCVISAWLNFLQFCVSLCKMLKSMVCMVGYLTISCIFFDVTSWGASL